MKNERKIRVFQKNTYVAVDYAGRDITVIRKDDKGSGLPVPGMSMDRSRFETADSLENELAAFVRSVRHREPPVVSGRDGRKALKVARDILDQIEEGGRRFLDSLR
jgi:predicted dehydrogenase